MSETGPFRATVVQTSLVVLHAVEDANGRALVFWMVPSIWVTRAAKMEELFEVMKEGHSG